MLGTHTQRGPTLSRHSQALLSPRGKARKIQSGHRTGIPRAGRTVVSTSTPSWGLLSRSWPLSAPQFPLISLGIEGQSMTSQLQVLPLGMQEPQCPLGSTFIFTVSVHSVCHANELCKQDPWPSHTGEHCEGPWPEQP